MLEINKIHLGDSYELIKQIPDNSIDCIYTDPPYNFHCGTIGKTGIFKNRLVAPGQEIINMNINKGYDFKLLDDFKRVMKKINIFIWCNKTQIKDYLNYFMVDNNITFTLISWHKTNCTPLTKNTWLPDTEYCLHFREKGILLNDGYHLKQTYYISSTNKNDRDKYYHPTIKPLELVEKHLLHATQEDDIILDVFSGSGTTCKACKNINRQFIGIEIDPKWHKISVDRLNNIEADGTQSLF